MPRTVIVTGSSSGIGEAAAKRFHADGCNVVFNSRSRADLEKATQGLDDSRVLLVEADVSKDDEVERLIAETVERFGGIDVLCNNAGVGVMGTIGELSDADWEKVISINAGGVYRCTKAALPHLEKSAKANGHAAIVNTSSVSGLGGDWGAVGYNASKGAVSNMTRAMALDFGARGIRVNAVAPSLTDTEMTEKMMKNEALMTRFRNRIPMGRAAAPEDIASVIAFLASDDARFVSGVILPVDGGLSASNGQPDFSG